MREVGVLHGQRLESVGPTVAGGPVEQSDVGDERTEVPRVDHDVMHRHLQRIGRYALEQQNAQQRARCQIERSVRLGPEVPIPLVSRERSSVDGGEVHRHVVMDSLLRLTAAGV